LVSAGHIGFWWINMKKRYNFKNLDTQGRIISKCTFRKYGQIADCCEHGNELYASEKCGLMF
jgi:hypothetical protein